MSRGVASAGRGAARSPIPRRGWQGRHCRRVAQPNQLHSSAPGARLFASPDVRARCGPHATPNAKRDGGDHRRERDGGGAAAVAVAVEAEEAAAVAAEAAAVEAAEAEAEAEAVEAEAVEAEAEVAGEGEGEVVSVGWVSPWLRLVSPA